MLNSLHIRILTDVTLQIIRDVIGIRNKKTNHEFMSGECCRTLRETVSIRTPPAVSVGTA